MMSAPYMDTAILFKLITNYGETSIRVPIAINNHYQLKFKEKLPNCDKTDTLLLNIQQSGIYLHETLLSSSANVTAFTINSNQLSLTGSLQNRQMSLSEKFLKAYSVM